MIWQDYAIIVLMVLGAWPVIMYYEAKGKKKHVGISGRQLLWGGHLHWRFV